MKLFVLYVGYEDEYYSKDELDNSNCYEKRYLIAESYEDAEEIVREYLHDNYNNVAYRLYEFDEGYGFLEENVYLDDEYSYV